MKVPNNNFGVGKYYNFIPQSIEELLEQNVKVTPIDEKANTKFFTFYDPDGNPGLSVKKISKISRSGTESGPADNVDNPYENADCTRHPLTI